MTKVTALTELTALTDDDVLYVVNDPGGVPASRKITAANLAATAMQTIAASGAAQTLDLTGRSGFDLTLTAACVLTFSNPLAAGYLSAFILVVRQGGAGGYAITWPGSVKWEGAAPTLTTLLGSIAALSFFTIDAGTTWFGGVVGDNYV